MFKSVVVVLLVLERLAQGKGEVHPAFHRQLGIGQPGSHVFDFIRAKAVGLQVGQAVVGFTEIGSQLDGAPVGFDAPFLVAHGFQDVAQAQVCTGEFWIQRDRLAIGLDGLLGTRCHGQGRPVIVMGQGIVRLHRQRLIQHGYGFVIEVQFLQHRAQVVPGGYKTGLGCGNALEYGPGILEAVGHDGNSCQQQGGVDVVGVLPHQGLGELFRLPEFTAHKQAGGFLQFRLHRRQLSRAFQGLISLLKPAQFLVGTPQFGQQRRPGRPQLQGAFQVRHGFLGAVEIQQYRTQVFLGLAVSRGGAHSLLQQHRGFLQLVALRQDPAEQGDEVDIPRVVLQRFSAQGLGLAPGATLDQFDRAVKNTFWIGRCHGLGELLKLGLQLCRLQCARIR